ncbi:MAG: ABC transporter ATP-binding protein [Bacilli bacterium]|nr:ABC transporter ATP-binding protein [Bacilli bacterium]
MSRGPRGNKGATAGLPKFDQIDKGVVKRLLSYIFKDYKKEFILVLVCIIFSSVASVSSSLFLEILIDEYIEPMIGVSNPIWTGLLKVMGIMAIIYLVGIISTFFYNRIVAKISQGVLRNIRNEMFMGMQKLPIKYFDTHTYGEIMSYYTNDTDTLREMIGRSVPQFISSAITIITVFCAMLYTSVYLTIMTILFVVVMFIVTGKVGGKASKYFVARQKSLADINGYIEEMINGQKVIKVFTYEDRAKDRFDKLNNMHCMNATRANQFANILGPILNNIGHIQYAFVGFIGGLMALNGIGGLTLGAIASFISLSKSFLSPISQISQQLNSIIMALAGAQRVFNLMDQEPEEDNGYVTLVNIEKDGDEIKEVSYNTGLWAWKKNDEYIELKGKIDFLNVDFGYEEEKQVLFDISLYAKPGQKIAFVGATGAGKTTITNLLNRFYDIKSGSISYDGIDIKDIKKNDLRRSLGMVLQDVNLFTGTIKDNIKYGKEDATDEDVVNASKLANAHDFIMRLPNKYETNIDGDGDSLSQGQKQLISIARAAINNPPVMILDEATSSIDTRTEKIVQNGMDKLMNGRTVLVIAHRLSTIQNSKAIMVMDHGKIIERGEHDYLIGLKGEYYQLYTGKTELE